jgi:ABC-type polar amino acid transport system ATPase subunit
MSIEIRHLTKTYGSFTAVKDVSLLVETGQLVALVGPSGSGKTTLLRSIAGLEQPNRGSGTVLLHGKDIAADIPVERAKDRFCRFNITPCLSISACGGEHRLRPARATSKADPSRGERKFAKSGRESY